MPVVSLRRHRRMIRIKNTASRIAAAGAFFLLAIGLGLFASLLAAIVVTPTFLFFHYVWKHL